MKQKQKTYLLLFVEKKDIQLSIIKIEAIRKKTGKRKNTIKLFLME